MPFGPRFGKKKRYSINFLKELPHAYLLVGKRSLLGWCIPAVYMHRENKRNFKRRGLMH